VADPWLLLLMGCDSLYLRALLPRVVRIQNRRTLRTFCQEPPARSGPLLRPGTADGTDATTRPGNLVLLRRLRPLALRTPRAPMGARVRVRPPASVSSPRPSLHLLGPMPTRWNSLLDALRPRSFPSLGGRESESGPSSAVCPPPRFDAPRLCLLSLLAAHPE